MKLSVRHINFLAALTCAGMTAYALYSQYVDGLNPCPLCVFQRIAVIVIGIVFLLAAIHNARDWGRHVYSALLLLASGGGVVVAARHVWLQNLPPDEVPACGPGLEYLLDSFPLADALKKIFSGSGECAEIDWQFLGLSMPMWVLIACAGLGVVGVVNNSLRKSH